MTRILQSINPCKHIPIAQLPHIARWIAIRNGLNTSEVMVVLQEINQAILFFNSQGTPVKLPGVGVFSPDLSQDKGAGVSFQADPALNWEINPSVVNAYRALNSNQTDPKSETDQDSHQPEDPSRTARVGSGELRGE